jgi:hypothetical protein
VGRKFDCTKGYKAGISYYTAVYGDGVPAVTIVTIQNQFWSGVGKWGFQWKFDLKTERERKCELNCGKCSQETGCIWGKATYAVDGLVLGDVNL